MPSHHSSSCHSSREFPRFAILAAEQLVGLVIADNKLLVAVPLQAATELERKHAEQTHVRGTMSNFDVADAAAFGFDGVEEVGKQFLDILIVRRVELRALVLRLSFGVGGVEFPAVF